MLLNIVTPCSRPENLHTISESINIPRENYRWIVVFDMDTPPDSLYIPENCEYHLYRDSKSVAGHAQRNFATKLIDAGHIYQNDDDTALHPELWENIKDLSAADMITFAQLDTMGGLRLRGDVVELMKVDSHNFIVSRELVGDLEWQIERYDADGLFAIECAKRSTSRVWIPKVLSVYNWLRP